MCEKIWPVWPFHFLQQQTLLLRKAECGFDSVLLLGSKYLHTLLYLLSTAMCDGVLGNVHAVGFELSSQQDFL